MARMKRILCSILALVLLLTNAPVVFATASAPEVKPIPTETVYNPLYQGLNQEDTTQYAHRFYAAEETEADVEAKATTDYRQIVAALRQGMENRQSTITLYFATEEILDKQWIKTKLFQDALAETDSPTQGDYLRWVWNSYDGSAPIAFTSETTGLNCYKIIFNLTYYTTKAQEDELTKEINRVLDGFSFTEETTSTQKLLAIYGYITANVRYDYDNLYNDSYTLKFTAYAALINKTAVCQGYAVLFYRMAEMCGIDTRVIIGTGGGGEHGWNISRLGDYYYYLDPTWDEGLTAYRYFLRGKNDFPDHENGEDYNTQEFFQKYPIADTYYDKDPSVDPDKKYRLFTEENVTLEFSHADYTGQAITPAVTVTYDPDPAVSGDEILLTENTDYAVTYQDNVSPGTATVTVTGLDIYLGSIAELTFPILPTNDERVFTKNDVTLSFTEGEYTGSEIVPTVQVLYSPDSESSDSAFLLTEGEDFTVSYQNNIAIGTATVTVSGLGHYKSCLVQIPFRILPKKEAAVGNLTVKLTAYNKVYLSWEETDWVNTDAQNQGYAIYYRKVGAKEYTYLVTAYDKTFCNIKNLASNTTYDFMVVKELSYGEETYFNGQQASVQITTLAKLTNAEPLTVTLTAPTAITIQWTPVPTAHGYMLIWRMGGDDAKWNYDREVSSENTTYVDENLAENTRYDYVVIPYHDIDGKRYVISSAPYHSVTTSTDLPAPNTVTAKLSAYNAATVSWSKVSGATHYKVYYRNVKNTEFKLLTTTTATSYKKTSLTSSATYEFKIVPCLKIGDTILEDASVKTVKISTGKNLSAPKTVTAKLSAYNAATVSWSKVSGATHYRVYYRNVKKTEFKLLTTTAKLTYKRTSLSSLSTYEFKIVPCIKTADGYCEDASYKTVKISTTKNLSAPKTVTAKLYGHDDVKVSWSKVSGAKKYRVYYRKSTEDSYTIKTLTDKTSYNFSGLADGVKYYFKVVPCSYVNGSYFSDDSYTTATATTLKKVSTPTVSKYSSSKVTVKWTNIAGESGYQISKSSSKTGTSIVSTYTTTSGNSKTVSATKGKTYYYKVRAFKTVDGKKIYGPWSSVKAYKLK